MRHTQHPIAAFLISSLLVLLLLELACCLLLPGTGGSTPDTADRPSASDTYVYPLI